jgi:glycine/D-amino acid oxidase-like deaminating enzyme
VAAVVVVGGGLAGLAAAARLARQRHEVTLLDPGSAGGPPRLDDEPGSFTLPAVYRDLFRKTGRPLESALDLIAVDPARRYVFPDGRVLDLPTGSRGAMLDAFGRALGPTAAREWDAFITWGGALWEAVRPGVVPDGEALGPSTAIPARPRLRDPPTRMLLDWYVFDAGADPGRAPADLAVLPYLEQAFGSWQVDGGLATLVAAIADRARKCGATLHGQTEVARLLVEDGQVTGVVVADGSIVRAEVVVDTVGTPIELPRSTEPRSTGPVTTVTVRMRGTEPTEPTVETVLLPRDGRAGVSVLRPDLAADPSTFLVRSTLPSTPALGDEREMVTALLDRLTRGGVPVAGADVEMSLRPSGAADRGTRWPRRPTGRLELRPGLREPGFAGLLRAVPRVGGSTAVPWLGLAAALVADACGTVPRAGSR